MSAAAQQAIFDEAMELSYQFRQNAALKNGLPDCRRITAKLPDDPPVKQEPPQVTVINQIPASEADKGTLTPGAVAVPASSSLLRKAAPFLIGAAGVGLPAGVYAWMNQEPTPIVQQADQSDRSMLQWVQDQGGHLPEGEAWQTK